MKSTFAIVAVITLMLVHVMAQDTPGEKAAWSITSKADEMTSKTTYTFNSLAISETKADFQIHCTDAAWTGTDILLDRPVYNRPDGIFMTGEIRLDDGDSYFQRLFVRDDMRTISLAAFNEPRRFVRAKKVAIRYQTIDGVYAVIVFEPPALEPNLTRGYCGENPQDQLPIHLTIENGNGKRVYDGSDWILCQSDGGREDETHVGSLPKTVEARSNVKVSVGDKATMKQLVFKVNGQVIRPEWQAVKERFARFTVTIHQP